MNVIIDFRTLYTLEDTIGSLWVSPKEDKTKAEKRQDVNVPACKF